MPTFPKISYVCPIPWGEMRGDERERHCSKCRRTVVNLSLLTEERRVALLEEERARPGSLCVAYYQRLSGEFVTPEAPLKPRESRTMAQLGVTAVATATLLLAAQQAPALRPIVEHTQQTVRSGYQKFLFTATIRTQEFLETLGDYFGIPRKPPPVIMTLGMVCPAPSAAPPASATAPAAASPVANPDPPGSAKL